MSGRWDPRRRRLDRGLWFGGFVVVVVGVCDDVDVEVDCGGVGVDTRRERRRFHRRT